MASVLGIDKKYGVKIVPSKEASWAGVRDKLVNGELDMAHVLYGLIYGVHLGIGGPKKDMAVLMTLNNNGQAITLSKKLADKGAVDGASLAKLMAEREARIHLRPDLPDRHPRDVAVLLDGRHGINPMKDAKIITVPPPQMVANMRVGNMDGYCVGEPWGQRAIMDGIGITAVTTQDIWKDHPEKVLGTTGDFVKKYPNTARAVTAADPRGRQVDRRRPAEQERRWPRRSPTRATSTPASTRSTSASSGRYQNGLGKTWDDPNHMKFFNDGAVNFPYLSDGMWFLTQHKRWGLLKEHPDYLQVAKQINQIDIYKQAAAATQDVSVPKEPMRSSKLIDGVGLGRQETRRSTPIRSRSRSRLRSPPWSVPFSIPRSKAAARPCATATTVARSAPRDRGRRAGRDAVAPRRAAAARLARVLAARAAAGARLRAAGPDLGAGRAAAAPPAFPSPLADLAAGARRLQRSVLQQGAERPGRRLERARLAAARRRSASAWRPRSASRPASRSAASSSSRACSIR